MKKKHRPTAAARVKQREHELAVMKKGFEPFFKKLFAKMCKNLGIPVKLSEVDIRRPFVDSVKDKPAGKRKKKPRARARGRRGRKFNYN